MDKERLFYYSFLALVLIAIVLSLFLVVFRDGWVEKTGLGFFFLTYLDLGLLLKRVGD